MDLESASELLQEKAKIRDDEIVQIQAAYDTEIQLLQSKLSTCKEEDRAYYEEQIANLEQDKQKRLQNSVTFTTNIYELSKNTTRNYWRESAT